MTRRASATACTVRATVRARSSGPSHSGCVANRASCMTSPYGTGRPGGASWPNTARSGCSLASISRTSVPAAARHAMPDAGMSDPWSERIDGRRPRDERPHLVPRRGLRRRAPRRSPADTARRRSRRGAVDRPGASRPRRGTRLGCHHPSLATTPHAARHSGALAPRSAPARGPQERAATGAVPARLGCEARRSAHAHRRCPRGHIPGREAASHQAAPWAASGSNPTARPPASRPAARPCALRPR